MGPDSAVFGAAAGAGGARKGGYPLQQQGAWAPVQMRLNALTLTGWLRCPDRCQDFTGGLKWGAAPLAVHLCEKCCSQREGWASKLVRAGLCEAKL